LIEHPAVPWAAIGRRVDRHPTTVAREVEGHGGRHKYRPATAVYARVLDMKATGCLRMRRPRRRSRQARHANTRPALANIAARPATVGDRSEVGHWEADQIVGAHNRSSMLWLTERVMRFSIPVTLPEGHTAAAMAAGLVEGLDQIPDGLLASITFDQGSEWANWSEIAEGYGIDCWFCDSHSPWQRGQIENLTANGAGGSRVAPTSRSSHPRMLKTPPTSSTANADAHSATEAPPPSTLQPPSSDR